MVDIITLNPIGSYKVDFFVHFCFEAHFLPQNFSNEGPLNSSFVEGEEAIKVSVSNILIRDVSIYLIVGLRPP